jgi:hypothetical protein
MFARSPLSCNLWSTFVNQVLQVNQYPLPRIDDIFAILAGGRKFTKLDIRQAYLHMPLDDDSKKLLAINTHKGLYEYVKHPMPFRNRSLYLISNLCNFGFDFSYSSATLTMTVSWEISKDFISFQFNWKWCNHCHLENLFRRENYSGGSNAC